jgi:RNA polymerase sigma factor (sigma-70 family)
MAFETEVLGDLSSYRENQLSLFADMPTPGAQPTPPDSGGDRRPGITADESWGVLVARLKEGDAAAMAELYQVFSKGIRFYLCRQVGPQELDDRVHDAFLIVVQSIQRGELRDPRRLMGFVRTVVRRMIAAQIDREIQSRREITELDRSEGIADQRSNPEKSFILRQKVDLIREILDSMNTKDREILRRFYVEEEHPDKICSDMRLSITQFRLLKSRAKARFGEEGRKKMQLASSIYQDSLRTFG